jgi:hypothetical protein
MHRCGAFFCPRNDDRFWRQGKKSFGRQRQRCGMAQRQCWAAVASTAGMEAPGRTIESLAAAAAASAASLFAGSVHARWRSGLQFQLQRASAPAVSA